MIIGIFVLLLQNEFITTQAPGLMTVKLSIENMDSIESNQNDVMLLYKITSSRSQITKSEERMQFDGKESYMAILKFHTDNIGSEMEFLGKVIIKSKARNSEKIIVFEKNTLHFSSTTTITYQNQPIVTTKFYDRDLEYSLNVEMSVKCDNNYYPEYNCTIRCVKASEVENCDSHGNKFCASGFILNAISQTCQRDWCSILSNECKNGGKCINTDSSITCDCPQLYRGTYCEEKIDLCKTYHCPNGTKCVMVDTKIDCRSLSRRTLIKESKVNPMFILILLCFVLMSTVTIVSMAACLLSGRKRKRMKNKQRQYYENTTLPMMPGNVPGDDKNAMTGEIWYNYLSNMNSFANLSTTNPYATMYRNYPQKHYRQMNRTVSDQYIGGSVENMSMDSNNSNNNNNNNVHSLNIQRQLSNDTSLAPGYVRLIKRKPTEIYNHNMLNFEDYVPSNTVSNDDESNLPPPPSTLSEIMV